MLPPTRAPLLKTSAGSADPLSSSSSRTLTHVQITASVPVEQEEEPTLPDGPVVTPRPPVRSTRRYSRKSTEESHLSSSRTGLEPLPLWAQLEHLLEIISRGIELESCTRGPVFADGDITGPNCRGPVFPDGDIAAQTTNTAPHRLAPPACDPSLEYSTDKVVLFWQPPSYFAQWSAPSFVFGGVPCSCAEQYMMVEKVRLYKDHSAIRLIMSSPDPDTHKRIGRDVRNFDSAVWDREKQNVVFSGNFAKFTQKPA